MLMVAINPIMLCDMLSVIMLIIAIKPVMIFVMLSVIMLRVVAPLKVKKIKSL
jgi:hypothetical protein